MTEPIGELFLRKTRYEEMAASEESLGIAQPPLEAPPREGATLVALPTPARLAVPELDLRTAIERRRSLRDFREQALRADELSWLLWACQGVKKVSARATFRNVPSAGARHALDTLVLVNRVEGIEAGLYRFLATRHELELLRAEPGLADQVTHACLGQHFIRTSAATFIWVADSHRMTWRYGQRGYRYLYLDAGHACQNLYLAAEAIDCGCCAVAAYDDALLDAALGLDGQSKFALYLAPAGKRP